MGNKIVDTIEDEIKYTVKKVSKTSPWDTELLVCQWYDLLPEKPGEHKFKFLINLATYDMKWVSVTKYREDNTKSRKQIEYLNLEEFKPEDFLGRPFNLKRRSILEDVHLDRFICSNNKCNYLIEFEHGMPSAEKLKSLGIIPEKNVSGDASFRNINMCTLFTEQSLRYLHGILKIYY